MGLCGNLQCAAWYLPAARARLISPVEADSSKPVRCPVSQVMQQPRVVGTFDFCFNAHHHDCRLCFSWSQ